MRRWWRIGVSVAAVAVAAFGSVAIGAINDAVVRDSAFTISRFASEITLAPDGSITVAEDLEVTFSEPRRGIFRDLDERTPFPSSGQYGIHDVRHDGGGSWPYTVERYEHGTRVRIGDPSVWLEPGTYRYLLDYTAPTWTVTLADDPSIVELRVDVPGFDWPTTIERTELTVALPGEATEAACVEGRRGSTRACATAPVVDGDVVRVELGALDVQHSATVAIRLPAAAMSVQPPLAEVAPLDASSGLGPWEIDAPAAALVLFALLAVPIAGWEAVAARRIYRDRVTDPALHDRSQPTALPSPPRRLPPAEVAGLLLRHSDQDLLLATLVDLDQRGLIETASSEEPGGLFSKASTVLTISRAPSGTVLPSGDDEVVHALVPGQDPTVLDGEYDRTMAARVRAASSTLGERARRVFDTQGLTHDDAGAVGRTGVRVLLLAAFVGWAVLAVRTIGSATPLAIAAGAGVAGLTVGAWFIGHLPWAHHRQPLNSAGRDLVNQARSFDTFIRSVEADQLDWAAGQPGLDHHHPALTLLPYAIALGHADSWFDRFGPLLTTLTTRPDGSTTAAGAAGAWWASSSSFSGVRQSQSGTSTSPSSSSGGGGGGGSGGGGGGGGSW